MNDPVDAPLPPLFVAPPLAPACDDVLPAVPPPPASSDEHAAVTRNRARVAETGEDDRWGMETSGPDDSEPGRRRAGRCGGARIAPLALASMIRTGVFAFAFALALTGCGAQVVFEGESSGGSGTGGSSDGGFGQGAGPTTSGPSVVTSTTTDATSTVATTVGVGGGTTCDTGQPAPVESPACDACVNCAIGGLCAESYDAFVNDPGAPPWIDCVFGDGSPQNPGCQDDACIQACNMQYPGVQELYFAVLQCLFCQACYQNCDGPTNCGMGF